MDRTSESVQFVVTDWIVEYYCPYVLRRFMNNSFVVDEVSRNFIDGMFGVIRDQHGTVNKKEVAFLALFAHLFHVQNPDTSPMDEDVFEDFLSSFRLVLECINRLELNITEYPNLVNEAEILRQKTVLQTVCVLCRKDQYGLAELISEKLSPMCRYGEKVKTKIEKILKAKQRLHSYLEEESFAKYMESVGNFMTSVYRTFKTPVLTLLVNTFSTPPSQHSKRRAASCKNLKHLKANKDTVTSNKVNVKKLDCNLEQIQSQVTEKAVSAGYECMIAHTEEEQSEGDEIENCMERTPKKKVPSKFSQTESPRSTIDGHDSGTSSQCLKSEHKRTRGSKSSDSRKSSLELQYCRNKKRAKPECSKSHSHIDGRGSDSSYVESERKRVWLCTEQTKSSGDSVCDNSLDESSSKRPKKTSLRKCHKKHLKWTASEEEKFYQAVQQHGVGNWALIRSQLGMQRTNVQLKDKWRTILRTTFNKLCRKFGPV